MFNKSLGSQLVSWSTEREIDKQNPDRNGYCANVTEELGEWLKAWDDDDEHEKIDALGDNIVFSGTEMIKMGYNPDKVLAEVFKELNSRTGAWSDEDQKWKKFKTEEAKSKWYKADFKGCKL